LELTRHPLIERLLSLGLPLGDYVVSGSGPLLAYGLREDLGDLDVVARGKAWEAAKGYARPVPAPSGCGWMVPLFEGTLEVFDRWLPGAPEPDEMIGVAEWVDGIPFCPLGLVLLWKEKLDRPKDREDVALIREFLSAAGQKGEPGPRTASA
jgi:hypothetical protein